MCTIPLFERPTCSALVITCSDFRFKTAERLLADASDLQDDYDLIARPGAIRSLVAPRNDAARESMEEEILLLHRLHAFTRVLMVNHVSCRAYDDLAAADDERAIHAGHLRTAGAFIEQQYAQLKAEAYLVDHVDGVLTVQHLSTATAGRTHGNMD